jgi:hypothetical protein
MNRIQRRAFGLLMVAVVILCSQLALAQTSTEDFLFVNYGGYKGVLKSVVELPDGSSIPAVYTFNKRLPKTGYVVFYEEDEKTISDIIVSFTGWDLSMYSDADPGMPTIPQLQGFGLKELGSVKEGDIGATEEIGHLFGLEESGDIIAFSGGDGLGNHKESEAKLRKPVSSSKLGTSAPQNEQTGRTGAGTSPR